MKSNHPTLRLSLLFFSLFLSFILQAQTNHPAVGYQRTIGSDYFGTNAANVIDPELTGVNDPNVVANVPKLQPLILRYPGGDQANWWNWRTGWWMNSVAVPSKWAQLPFKPNTLENLKPLLDSCHATLMFLLNMVTDSLPDQLAMLQHASSIGIPVKYVEMGGELYPGQTADDTMVYRLYPNAHAYGVVANKWIDTIRKYFPSAKFSVPACFNSYGGTAPIGLIQWNDTLFKYANHTDAISLHPYVDAEDPQADSNQVKEYAKDINSYLYQPFFMFNTLEPTSQKAALFGKEIWNTEYNLSDLNRAVHGMWAQGLFIATQTLEFLYDTRITHAISYTADGNGVHGMLFYDNTGFQFGQTDDGNFLGPVPPPPTTPWSYTSTGNTISWVNQCMRNAKYATPLSFSPGTIISYLNPMGTYNNYSALYGWLFSTDTNTSTIIMNFDSLPHTISTTEIWPSGGTYQQRFTYALNYIAGPSNISSTGPSPLGSTISLPGFSITYITGRDIPPPPPPSIHINTAKSAICIGQSTTLSVPSGYLQYLWSNGATTPSIVVNTQGKYWVRVWSSANGYYATDSTFITVNGLPKKPNIGNATTTNFCQGGSVNLLMTNNLGGNLTYQWNNGLTGQQITVTTSGSYYMFDIDSNGCQNVSDTIVVTVHPLPTPSVHMIGPTSICYNQSTQIACTLGYTKYNWSNGMSGNTKDTIAVSLPGTYSCTVTDVNGCIATSPPSPNITVWTMHTPAVLSSGPLTFCPEANIYLYSDSTYTTYQWIKGSGNVSGATNKNFYPTIGGTYKVTVSESHGCSATSSQVNVTVYNDPAPGITVTGGTTLCQGNTTNLSSTQTYPHYLWNNGATSQAITVGASGNYSVTVTDNNGCMGTSGVKTITVNPLPNPVITPQGSTSFCNGGSVTLNAGTYTKYAWSNGKTLQTISVATQGTYSVTVTDANSCSNTSPPVTVTVWPLPNPAITPNGATTFCSGGSVNLSTTSYVNYQWVLGSSAINGATNQSYNASAGGTYKVTVTDQNGCLGTSGTSIPVTVNSNPSPGITVTGGTTFCEGGSSVLKCNNVYPSYLWNTGAQTQSITVTSTGNYNVTVTDGNGCQGTSVPKGITVNPLPNPVITPQGSTTFCNGGSVVLNAGAGYTKYAWSNGKTTQSITVTTQGSYNVKVTDANSCSNTSLSVPVTVFIVPNPVITPSGPTIFCAGGSVLLSTLTGFNKYQWLNGTNNINGATQQSYSATTGATYKVAITDGNGCSATSATGVKVTVNTNPTASITYTGTTNICNGKTYTLKAKTGTGYLYQWYNDGNKLIGSTGSSLVVSQAGAYNYVVTNASGCIATSNTITFTANCRDDGVVQQNSTPSNSLLVYPNPSTGGIIHIELKLGDDADEQCLLEVRNSFGVPVMQHVISTNQGLASYEWMPNGTIAAGMYLVIVHSGNQTFHSQIIVTH